MIKKLSVLILLILFISASIAYSKEQSPTQEVENFFQMVQDGKKTKHMTNFLKDRVFPLLNHKLFSCWKLKLQVVFPFMVLFSGLKKYEKRVLEDLLLD